MKHVHADLIKAWADDPDISLEYRRDPCEMWKPVVGYPSWNDYTEFRIKPEVKFPETTMTHEQLEHAYSAAPNRWELKLTEFANAVLAHAVETGQLVVPGETVEGPKFGLVPATKTHYGLIPTRDIAIAQAVKNKAIQLSEPYSNGQDHYLRDNLDPVEIAASVPK